MKTLADVAKLANVSTATVSRYLNNPEKVSKHTSALISKAISDLQYTPNAFARSLVTKESRKIGVIIPDINNLFYPAVLKGIQDASLKYNYHAIFCNTDNNINVEKQYIKSLREQQIDAFIIMGSRNIDPNLSKHLIELSQEIPTVMINDYIIGSNIYTVMTDEVEGAYIATKNLINMGHKKIYHITVEKEFTTAKYKLEGYMMAMKEFNIDVNDGMVFNATSYADSGIITMDRIIESGEIPSAVFCGNDQIAIGAITSILSHNLKVPEDVSIIGFSDIPISGSVYPPLTTVGQSPHKTGWISVETAIRLIKGEDLLQKKIVLKTEFIERKSTMKLEKKSILKKEESK